MRAERSAASRAFQAVSERGDSLRRGAGADTARILAQGDIAAVAEAILDTPALADESEQVFRAPRARGRLVTARETVQPVLRARSRVRSMRQTRAAPRPRGSGRAARPGHRRNHAQGRERQRRHEERCRRSQGRGRRGQGRTQGRHRRREGGIVGRQAGDGLDADDRSGDGRAPVRRRPGAASISCRSFRISAPPSSSRSGDSRSGPWRSANRSRPPLAKTRIAAAENRNPRKPLSDKIRSYRRGPISSRARKISNSTAPSAKTMSPGTRSHTSASMAGEWSNSADRACQ